MEWIGERTAKLFLFLPFFGSVFGLGRWGKEAKLDDGEFPFLLLYSTSVVLGSPVLILFSVSMLSSFSACGSR